MGRLPWLWFLERTGHREDDVARLDCFHCANNITVSFAQNVNTVNDRRSGRTTGEEIALGSSVWLLSKLPTRELT